MDEKIIGAMAELIRATGKARADVKELRGMYLATESFHSLVLLLLMSKDLISHEEIDVIFKMSIAVAKLGESEPGEAHLEAMHNKFFSPQMH